jgi:Tol biopolymer transport system component
VGESKRVLAAFTALGVLAGALAAALAASPSRTRIAFVRQVDGHERVFTMRSDGTKLVRASHTRGSSYDPDLSSDGTMLAYERSFSIYVVKTDGTGRKLLVENAFDPVWSPHGDKLLFTRYRVDSDVAIFSINADGTGQKELTSSWINVDPAWSDDGSKIVFVRDADLPQLWIMNADGSGKARLTHAPGKEDGRPKLSPDAARVVFTRSKSYGFKCLYRTDIFVTDVDGNETKNLTKSCRRRENSPQWSPDGSKILFTRQTSSRTQIFVMNADGTGVTRLTSGPEGNRTPVWSPDGSMIAFVSARDGNLELYVMDSDGANETRLTRTSGPESQPAW